MENRNDAFARLMAMHPWPEPPVIAGVAPFTWALDGGGRHLIDAVISARASGILVEIGSFMGGAARRWLTEFPDLRCVCIDPWGDNLINYVKQLENRDWALKSYGVEAIRHYASLLAAYGPLRLVQNNLAEFRERCILVPMGVPEAFDRLAEAGLQPAIVFLDALKRWEEFQGADAAFPDAIMTGDDWSWKDDAGDFPIRHFAAQLAAIRGGTLYAHRATFVLAEHRHGLSVDQSYVFQG